MKIGFHHNTKTGAGNPIVQYLCTITGTLTILSGAMHYGWPTPSLPKLQAEDSHIFASKSEGSWIAVMMLFGGAVGSVLAGCTIDVFGRKKAILITAFPFFTAWIMIAYSASIEVLYAARFIAGLADGMTFTVVPIYLGEIADAKIRGLLGSSCSVIMIFGILLVNIMGIYLSFTQLAVAASVIPLLLLVTFVWMPETPYYLIMKGKMEAAKQSLRVLRGLEDVDLETDRVSAAVKAQTCNTSRLLDLYIVKSNRKAILILLGLRTVQQLSGISPITFYANIIFAKAELNISANITSTIYFSVQCIMTILSSLLLDKAGRRFLLILSTVGCAFCLCAEGAYYLINDKTDISSYNAVPIIAIIAFIVTYSIGLGTVPVLMLGELFPTNVKAFALCLVEIYYSIVATVTSKLFQITADEYGMSVPFLVFGGCCAFGLLFVWLCVPETKGKTLEDIQQYLKDQKDVEHHARSVLTIP